MDFALRNALPYPDSLFYALPDVTPNLRRRGVRGNLGLHDLYAESVAFTRDAFRPTSESGSGLLPAFSLAYSTHVCLPHYLLVADEEGVVHVQHTQMGSTQQGAVTYWKVHDQAIFSMKCVPDDANGNFVTASGDRTLKLYSPVEDGAELGCFVGHFGSVKCFDFQCDNANVFASGARDGHILLWDSRSGTRDGRNTGGYLVNAHNETKPRQRLHVRRAYRYAPPTNASVKFWDIRKLSPNKPEAVHTIQLAQDRPVPFTSLCLDSTKTQLFASCMDKTIYRFDVGPWKTPEPSAKYVGADIASFFVKCSLSPNDELLGCGSSDYHAYLFKVADPDAAPVVLSGHASQDVMTVAFCPYDPYQLATNGEDKVLVWHAEPYLERQAEGIAGKADRDKRDLATRTPAYRSRDRSATATAGNNSPSVLEWIRLGQGNENDSETSRVSLASPSTTPDRDIVQVQILRTPKRTPNQRKKRLKNLTLSPFVVRKDPARPKSLPRPTKTSPDQIFLIFVSLGNSLAFWLLIQFNLPNGELFILQINLIPITLSGPHFAQCHRLILILFLIPFLILILIPFIILIPSLLHSQSSSLLMPLLILIPFLILILIFIPFLIFILILGTQQASPPRLQRLFTQSHGVPGDFSSEQSKMDPSMADAQDYSHLIDLIFRFRYSFRRGAFCVVITVCFLKRRAMRRALQSLKLSTARCLVLQSKLRRKVHTVLMVGFAVALFQIVMSWLSKFLVSFNIIVFPTQTRVNIIPFWSGYWNIMSGLCTLPGEYAYGLIAGLTVAAVIPLTAQIDALLEQAQHLQSDLRNGHQVNLPKCVANMRMAYSDIKRQIAAVEDGFGWIIVMLIFADIAQIFSFLPLFLVQGIVSAFSTYFLHLLLYIICPALQLVVILTVSARNAEKSAAFCDELRQILSYLNKAELSETEDNPILGNKCPHPSRYGVALRYPMGLEVGFLGFLKQSTITEVVVVFGGYLCFLIERGERSSRALQTLSRMFDGGSH
ncbi:putative Denticleless protein-like protein [Hypsibius exemplaris]|uniref:Denticleless protein-like protein n=1 Tax=Hypsibius exemplaris TaxID=2072580 RepID=A0A1W0WK85_HYPEX|nr:putative Denticleless protein-like protein [Hypsibius exemplaris]